ncbi:MAG: hypothetical protein MJK12_16885 [Colwellia sp.]|nr:hypothetical protein [Colwellia sp.]
MFTISTNTQKRLKIAAIILFVFPFHTMAEKTEASSGKAVDNEYAAKVWQYMVINKLEGDGRIRSYPFVGSRPHGSIQEVISTEAIIEGEKGKLIVKHNYGAKEELTPHKVYSDEQAKNYVALTIMFQREKGYDTNNSDWFWAEYNPDGSIINYQGVDLSGRSEMCLGCHTPLGGKDREVLNGGSK